MEISNRARSGLGPAAVRSPREIADALLGREGLRISAEEVSRFYADSYLEANPALDADDTATKAGFLLDACRRAEVSASTILEVGCGSGELLLRMKAGLGAARALGVDYSPAIAERARVRTGLEIVVSDGTTLPIASGAVDLVYFADVLEHVLSPVAWLREVGRVAKQVAFLVPLEWGVAANLVYATRRAQGKQTNLEQYGHIWRFRRGHVFRMFDEAGLELLTWQVHHPPIRLEGFNRAGRAFEHARSAVRKVAPRAEEFLFGGVPLVGLAVPRTRDAE